MKYFFHQSNYNPARHSTSMPSSFAASTFCRQSLLSPKSFADCFTSRPGPTGMVKLSFAFFAGWFAF